MKYIILFLIMAMMMSITYAMEPKKSEKRNELREYIEKNMAYVLNEATKRSMVGQPRLLHLLLASKADPNLSYRGQTPLQLVRWTKNCFEKNHMTMPSDYRRNVDSTEEWLRTYKKDKACKK